MPYNKHIKDLYERLSKVGYDSAFVRSRILPEWWDDSLAEVPANRALAEAAVSRALGFPISALSDPKARLETPAAGGVRLKRNKGVKVHEVAPSILLGERTAKAILKTLVGLRQYGGSTTAAAARGAILSARPYVHLEALLSFSWAKGIPVIHIAELPKASKKFTGMALFCEGTPAVVLASRRDSPSWLAFHLAHELGHIFLGHVGPGVKPLVDSDIDQTDNDVEENAADEFACELLTGHRRPYAKAIYGCVADKLVDLVRPQAEGWKADPGVLALIYGKWAERMGVAQGALKLMGLDSGAHAMIGSFLRSHLPEDIPAPRQPFVALASAA